jgi:hypothetical protein
LKKIVEGNKKELAFLEKGQSRKIAEKKRGKDKGNSLEEKKEVGRISSIRSRDMNSKILEKNGIREKRGNTINGKERWRKNKFH